MFKYLFLLGFLGVIAGLLTFGYVDNQVAERLNSRSGSSAPAILSDNFRIPFGKLVPPALLRVELARRQYKQRTNFPAEPGEYFVTNEEAHIFTNRFLSAKGERIEPVRLRYVFEDGSIWDADKSRSKLDALVLEPESVALVGSGNLRVSRHKTLEQIPVSLQQAVVAIEDVRFFSHFGVDLWGISRAMVENIRAGRIVQGGSTITQQLAKNLLFSPKKTIGRKVMEALAAISLEQRLGKEEILELYLNEVYLGQEGSVAIHGVDSAAYTFFGKSAERLTVEESATIAGIIQAPSAYAPRRYPKRATDRRNVVLTKMVEGRFLSESEAQNFKRKPMDVVKEKRHARRAPYFVSALQKTLADSINLEAAVLSGIQVYTGVELGLQRCAERAVEAGLEDLRKKYAGIRKSKEPLQAALVSIEPYSGLVKAWVGGKDFSENQFDRAIQGERQIGSTIKAFLYLTALDEQLNDYRVATTRSVLSDRPLTIKIKGSPDWEPKNYDRQFRGDVTLRFALENSLNVPAVYVGQRIGIRALAQTVKNFRVIDEPPLVPSLALGAADTSLMKLTSAYGALANGGRYVEPRLFISALDSNGETLVDSPIIERRVAGEAPVFVLTNMLQGVIERGTARAVRREGYLGPAAGKTGTSSDTRDAWFIGFTPTLVTGVWVGFDDNRVHRLTGGQAAAPIWAKYMLCAEPYYEEETFVPPPGVIAVEIDTASGELATPNCPRANLVREIFVKGTEPQATCGYHGGSGRTPREFDDLPREPRFEEEPRENQKEEESFWDRIFG